MDISTTESLPTSSESTEISEFTEHSHTVNSSEINMETTMIDSDIPSSVMYQTGNQNYFTCQCNCRIKALPLHAFWHVAYVLVLAILKRGENYGPLDILKKWKKFHCIKRDKQHYKEWVKEGKYEDFCK